MSLLGPPTAGIDPHRYPEDADGDHQHEQLVHEHLPVDRNLTLRDAWLYSPNQTVARQAHRSLSAKTQGESRK